MTKDNLHISDEDLTVIIENTLEKNKSYYHCCVDGVIFKHKVYFPFHDYKTPLINVKLLTGKTSLGKPFIDYNITSGYTRNNYLKLKKEIDNMK